MAIINSLAIGKSVKSAGNLTYKTVRGRTIASQRITQNKSNTVAQQTQRSKFGAVATSMKYIQQYINTCYEKSKYGSSRNMFSKVNKDFNFGGLYGELGEGLVTLSDAMLSALTNEPVRQLGVLSYGSLPGFLNITYSSIPDYKYGEVKYGELRVIGVKEGYGVSSYEFSLSTPARRADVKLAFFGFSDNGLISEFGTITDAGTASFDNLDVNLAVQDSMFSFTDDTSEFVKSLKMACTISQIDEGKCPIGIFVPVIGGKVPTITAVFAAQSKV